MLVNISTIDDGNFDNKQNINENIITKVYKNHIEKPNSLKIEENNTNDKGNIHDSSSNYLKQNHLGKLFPLGPSDQEKRRISRTTFKKNKLLKKVTFDNPFILIVPIESYKEYNLKMTYSEYESVPDSNKYDSICPCKKSLCSIF